MKSQSKKIEKNQVNIMLLCIVAIAIMITLSNMITALVIGRSHFTQKSARINEMMLLIEDANVQYQREFLILESENVELVEYYFLNGFYKQVFPTGFAGNNSEKNRILKRYVNNSFQKMINEYYKANILPYESGVNKDEDAAVDEIKRMADYLYIFLTAKRLTEATELAENYSMGNKLNARKKLINLDTTVLHKYGTFDDTKRTWNIDKNIYTYKGVSANIDSDTLLQYYDICWPSNGTVPPIGTYQVDTIFSLYSGDRIGVSKFVQETEYRFLQGDFEIEYNGFAYSAKEIKGKNKMNTTTWIIRGE